MEHCAQYKLCWKRKDREGMDLVVQSIIDKIHSKGGRFMEQNWRKIWIELSDKDRKQKVDRYVFVAAKNHSVSGLTTEAVSAMLQYFSHAFCVSLMMKQGLSRH